MHDMILVASNKPGFAVIPCQTGCVADRLEGSVVAISTKDREGKVLIIVVVVLILAGLAGLLIWPRLRPRHEFHYNKGVIHLRSGNTEEAIKNLKKAIAKKPDFKEARLALVRTYGNTRQFAEAEQEVDEAVRAGVDEAEAALLKAGLHSMRADYRLQSAGDALDIELCESVIQEDIRPAITIVQEHAGDAQAPASAYTRLGDLYMKKSRVLLQKWQLLREAQDLAVDLNQTEEAEARNAEALEVLPAVGEAQQEGIRAYGRAIQLDEALAAPRLKLAEQALNAFVPRPDRARSVLSPLIEQDEHHRQARLLMAQAERLEGDFDKALEHVQAAAPVGDEKEKTEDQALLLAEAQILVEAERWEEAAPLTEKLIEMQPHDPRVNYLHGATLLFRGSYDEAANHLQHIFARTDRPWPKARLQLARALQKGGRREQAITAYRQAVTEVGDATVTGVKIGQELGEVRYEASLALARELEQESPELAAENAMTAFRTRPYETEAFQLALAVRNELDAPWQELRTIVLQHAAALAARNDLDGAIAVCEKGLELAPEGGDDRLRLARARLLSKRGDYTDAVQAYEGLNEGELDVAARHLLASLHARLGHHDRAKDLYRELHESNPDDFQALLGLVVACIRGGDREGALEALRREEKEGDADRARMVLVSLYAREGEMEEAVELARALVEDRPEEAAAQVLLARLLWVVGDRQEATERFGKALELNPDYLPAYARGLLDLQRGDTEAAIELFRDARQRFPDSPAPPLNLAVALQAQGRTEETLDLLRRLSGAGGREEPRSRAAPWCLAVVRAGMGEGERAVEISKASPTGPPGLLEDRAELLQKIAQMEDPGRVEVAVGCNLAFVLQMNGDLGAAMREVQALQERLPEEPVLVSWRLGLMDQRRMHEEAVAGYRQLIAKRPEFLYARIALAQSLAGHDRGDEAVKVLEEALEHSAEEQQAVIHRYLAQMYEQHGRYDEAIASYREAAKFRPRAPEALNNMAYLMVTQKGDAEGALPLAQKALELGGPNPGVLDTVGWIYAAKGEYENAVKYLEAARKGAPQQPTIRYHLAVVYLKMGRTGEGKSELRQALAISRDFPEAENARKLLEDI